MGFPKDHTFDRLARKEAKLRMGWVVSFLFQPLRVESLRQEDIPRCDLAHVPTSDLAALVDMEGDV